MLFSVIRFIIGILILGEAKQFVSSYGILGLIAFLLTFAAGAFEIPMLAVVPKISLVRAVNLGVLLDIARLACKS